MAVVAVLGTTMELTIKFNSNRAVDKHASVQKEQFGRMSSNIQPYRVHDVSIFRRDAVVGSAHRLPVFSTSARRDVLLSAIGRLLLPAFDLGTVYLLTSGLPHHSHFVKSEKLIYSSNLTQTLFYNYNLKLLFLRPI